MRDSVAQPSAANLGLDQSPLVVREIRVCELRFE
jgi:hypothetical protein